MVHWRKEKQTTSVFCLENPMKSMKRKKDMTLKGELTRLVDAQYANGEEWRNSSRKNEETEPKQIGLNCARDMYGSSVNTLLQ